MDPLALLGKLFRRKKLPLTHEEMITRAPRLDAYFRWAQGKRLLIFDPPFWGFHDLFVDRQGNVLLICLKAEGEAFAFLGDERGAGRMLKFGPGPRLNAGEDLDPGILEWVIYDDYIVYRGPFFPISRTPYYLGRIAATLPFEETIRTESIPERISSLFEWYRTHGRTPSRSNTSPM
ncbi:MAG: hypothetical protein RQ767_06620 [Thermovirgaceae bacterium]|nr:hypothetical protein [Thermovirgaceae bacterium]